MTSLFQRFKLIMEEQIADIAKKIQIHRDFELAANTTNSAVGRVKALYANQEQQFWLINKEATVVQFHTDFNGNPVPSTAFTAATTYKADGIPVPKNSKLGGILILHHDGVHAYDTPKGKVDVQIFNRASYTPSQSETQLATDLLIRIAGDSRAHSFQDISKILSLQNEIDQEKLKLEQASNEEAELLVQRISQKQAEQKYYLNKAQSFIRKYAELRYQPILDPIQEDIKRSKLFDGALIINGGPGTGKTTSLIQRIKFLISATIEEYFPLTQAQKEVLFDQKTSWIFYSPNELLALFLRNSMRMEELAADDSRVKVWKHHKSSLVKTYKLVDSSTKRPFLIYNRPQNVSLILNTPEKVKATLDDFQAYFLKLQRDKINKVLEIDITPFSWRNSAKTIQNYLQQNQDLQTLDQAIRLFTNLDENYKSDADSIVAGYTDLIQRVASRIQIGLRSDELRMSDLTVILREGRNSNQDSNEDEDDDTEIELEDFEESVEPTVFDFEKELFTKLRSLCRKKALVSFDKAVQFTKQERLLIEKIPEVESQVEYEQLGQIAFYKKFFQRITRGLVANVLREIPGSYKKFRRTQLAGSSASYNLTILDELVKKDRNSRIHSDEQALLLSFINGICSKIAISFPRQYSSISHPFINAYKANCKPVIAIDEATDFSLIDLTCIYSFRHPSISSVTLSGDIMQRMTTEGVNSWDHLFGLIPSISKRDLEVSYRQSPTLLSLAKLIYTQANGEAANYRSYIDQDDAEPKPLMLCSLDEDEKLAWIADRIVEIYKAYGESIPSIAIFLPEESQLDGFAAALGIVDTLADVGISVKACRNGEVLGDSNTVRVFSIDKIKGLEFEAVFFHNLDRIYEQGLASDLLLKYLYVGLSRATFYVALTLQNGFSNDLLFLESSFRQGEAWTNY